MSFACMFLDTKKTTSNKHDHDDYYSNRRGKNDQYYDDKDYSRKNEDASGRNAKTNKEYKKQEAYYDDYNYDDYDPDEELAKLNSSWTKGQNEKGDSTGRVEERTADEVMVIDVEDFNDDNPLDFFPASTSKSKQAAKEPESYDLKRKSGSNAIFGDHWLDGDETEKDSGPSNNEDKIGRVKGGDSKLSSSRNEVSSNQDDPYEKGSKSRGNDKHLYSTTRQTNDNDSSQYGGVNEHSDYGRKRNNFHDDLQRSKAGGSYYPDTGDTKRKWTSENDSMGRQSLKGSDDRKQHKIDAKDSWGMEGTRDRLQEEMFRDKHEARGRRSTDLSNDDWGAHSPANRKAEKYVSPSRGKLDEENDWTNPRKVDEGDIGKLRSPALRTSASEVYSSDDHISGREFNNKDRVSPHVQSGVSDTLRSEVSRLQNQIEEMRAQHLTDVREMEIATQSLRSSLQVFQMLFSILSER